MSVFPETPPEMGGGWRALEYKFTLRESAPPRSAQKEVEESGGGELTFVTTLSCGKVTARPLENQRGGEHRSGGFSFIYLGRHAAPGVLAGQ